MSPASAWRAPTRCARPSLMPAPAASGRYFSASSLVRTRASWRFRSDAVELRARLENGRGRHKFGASRRQSSPPSAERTRGMGVTAHPYLYGPAPAFPVPPNRAGSNRGRWSAPPPPPIFLDPISGPVRSRMSPDNSLDFAATRVQHTPMRLLIIEDDRDAAEYLVKAFREVGHVADWAADGEDGLAHALAGGYDVLIV